MKRGQQGGLTIEFVLTLIPFMALVIAMFEICRFLLTGSVLDSALSLAARESVVVRANHNISDTVQSHITDLNWSLLDSKKIEVEGRYFPTIEALAAGAGDLTYSGEPFAEYTLTYSYQPMWIPGLDLGLRQLTTWKKTVLVVHERSAIHGP